MSDKQIIHRTINICTPTKAIRLPALTAGEVRLDPAEVAGFFPAKLSSLFQLSKADIKFFGTFDVEQNGPSGLRMNYYLAVNIQRPSLPVDLGRRLTLWCTDDDRIRGEAHTYDKEMMGKYPELQGSVPLIIIRIRSNWFQEDTHPLKVMELHRYADHQRFRGRGLATSILQSVCQQLRSKATEFLYVNFPVERWPKSSQVVPTSFASPELRQSVDACFGPASGYKGFDNDFSRSGFIVLTDPRQHALECEKSARIRCSTLRLG